MISVHFTQRYIASSLTNMHIAVPECFIRIFQSILILLTNTREMTLWANSKLMLACIYFWSLQNYSYVCISLSMITYTVHQLLVVSSNINFIQPICSGVISVSVNSFIDHFLTSYMYHIEVSSVCISSIISQLSLLLCTKIWCIKALTVLSKSFNGDIYVLVLHYNNQINFC